MVLTCKPASIGTPRRILIAAALSAIAFATCASALALHTDVAAPAAEEQGRPAKIHVDPKIMSGQKIAGENPEYPKEARAKKIQGTVSLAVTIGKDGAPLDIHLIESPNKALTDSAMKAVHTWRWRPYLLNGEPVEVETTVRVTYNLEG